MFAPAAPPLSHGFGGDTDAILSGVMLSFAEWPLSAFEAYRPCLSASSRVVEVALFSRLGMLVTLEAKAECLPEQHLRGLKEPSYCQKSEYGDGEYCLQSRNKLNLLR